MLLLITQLDGYLAPVALFKNIMRVNTRIVGGQIARRSCKLVGAFLYFTEQGKQSRLRRPVRPLCYTTLHQCGTTPMTFASTLGTDIQQTLPTSDTTIRSALLTSLQPIGASRLFLNPVADEYPELAERYLAVIKEPVSVREIKYRLNNKTTRYHVLYEVYHDLALLTHNCLLFNPHNDFLRDECA